MIGEDKLIKFSGVRAGEACTVVLRGATSQMIDEAERSADAAGEDLLSPHEMRLGDVDAGMTAWAAAGGDVVDGEGRPGRIG